MRAVLSLGVLITVGFLAGALAGFLWEEPRLVMAYLGGETEAVDWSVPDAERVAEPEPVEPPAQVAAAPPPAPKPAAAPPPAPKPAAEPAPKPAPEPVAAAAPAGRFAVQVGAFGESASAEKLAARLRERGYTTYVVPATSGNGNRWRVRVGPVAQRSQAEALASKLAGEKLPTWVLDESAS